MMLAKLGLDLPVDVERTVLECGYRISKAVGEPIHIAIRAATLTFDAKTKTITGYPSSNGPSVLVGADGEAIAVIVRQFLDTREIAEAFATTAGFKTTLGEFLAARLHKCNRNAPQLQQNEAQNDTPDPQGGQ